MLKLKNFKNNRTKWKIKGGKQPLMEQDQPIFLYPNVRQTFKLTKS